MTPERWEKIEQLFHSAAERTGEERAAYLERGCAGDAELRREVESLLAHGQTAEGWLGGEALKEMAEEVLDGARGVSLNGQQLGPYQVLAAIGAGGMGEVYRARDTRLNRLVAIKVLPKQVVQRKELRERLEREARTIASLNHAHICALYDVGHQDGVDYLVLEYLEGETLAERLKKGPLPIDQALRYAIEIADALDKAHRKGITHRDLKPANIMLTKSGTKLLDFGLAKLRRPQPGVASLSALPTEENDLTGKGAILGTLQYMAPEQLEGKEADARTDIFAFGSVVYEMATGKKAFEARSQASLIAKILETDSPPMSSLQPMTPAPLDRSVKRCLAKDPDDRWQTARDLELEFKWIAEDGTQASSPPAVPPKSLGALGRRLASLIAASAFITAVIVGLAVWSVKPAPAPSAKAVTRFTITLPPGQSIAQPSRAGLVLALSPDGSKLTYVAIESGVQRIYLRQMNGVEAKPISGTEGALDPFFSPDSQWLGFFAGGKLKKVSVNGGAAVVLADASAVVPVGGSWGSKGSIALGGIGGLQEVPDAGGTVRALTHVDKELPFADGWPEFLSNEEAVLFTAGGISAPRVGAQSLRSGERLNLAPGAMPRYAPSGHLLYVQAGTLMAAPFDLQRLMVNGAAVPVVEGLLESPLINTAQYSISSTGSLAYVLGSTQTSQSRLVWVSRNGVEQPLSAPPHLYESPRLSPDGRTIAIASFENGGGQIWSFDLSRQTLSRFTFHGNNLTPTWTPDGKYIAFRSSTGGPVNLFWQRADGSGGLERLTTSENGHIPLSFSPDGRLLAFVEQNPTTGDDIWVLHVADRKAQPFLKTPFNETAPRFSPDGRWLTYVSDESGRYEVYVQPYPGPGGKYQISTDGGSEPVWNPNGKELFYRSGTKMMAVDIYTEPGFAAGKPRQLFEGDYVLNAFPGQFYDVSPDGQRFLMLKPVDQDQAQTAPTQINVVLNWFEELKQKVPTGEK